MTFAGLAASSCATGSSRSLAMAPVAFSIADDGDLLVARADAGGAASAQALSGDFAAGVVGYDVVGGNALLPTRPLPVSLIAGPNPLVSAPGVFGLAQGAAAAVPGVLNATTSPLTATLDRGVADLAAAAPPLAGLPPPGGVINPVVGSVGDLAGGGLGGAIGVVGPALAPVQPVIGAATGPVIVVNATLEPTVSALVTQGAGLLGGANPPSAPPPTVAALAGGAVTGLLTTLRRGP